MTTRPLIAAYVYPGWHRIDERDESFYPGFTEWDLVRACTPRFEGHEQPKVPAWGEYDDRDPVGTGARLRAAAEYGVDAFVYGFFWCRGKRVFQEALDSGFLGSAEGRSMPFAVMWANRMPRRVLPVRRSDLPVIDRGRSSPTDVDDFVEMISYVAARYFSRPNYLRRGGLPYYSVFDSTFFILEIGPEKAAEAIRRARVWLKDNGFQGMHLAAIEPLKGCAKLVKEIGFDSVTNYVLLPYWKGKFLQDYSATAERRAGEWAGIASATGLPYDPAVSPGWDSSPRAADFGAEKPRKYPWWPIVVGSKPELFREALARALRWSSAAGSSEPVVFVSSLNEWSEGHYLEPDTRFGMGWLEALRDAKRT